MQPILIFLPVLALANSALAAPIPKCGWKNHSALDITKEILDFVRIDNRATLTVNEASIANPVNINTRSAPPPDQPISLDVRIDC